MYTSNEILITHNMLLKTQSKKINLSNKYISNYKIYGKTPVIIFADV